MCSSFRLVPLVCFGWYAWDPRKSLDKILELGKETGWVIAYEPDTKDCLTFPSSWEF